ncbi:Oxygen-independent coproporphyrinogen III oxidase [Thalassocella blandensis]|nr:Oxygen-independent coproporphyrinogen III oxidase [Thalassocella blandensis]
MDAFLSHTTGKNIWQSELIRKYDLAGPRYTSYPTALQFSDKVGFEQWKAAVDNSNAQQTPLSLYFHIPFCDTVCYYCACSKIITANKKIAEPYLHKLMREISLQAHHISPTRSVKQLHWGGGTPTYLNHEEMSAIMSAIKQNFAWLNDDSGEYSIEIHPAGVDTKRISQLRSLGFNRLSMGIQDFDPQVQRAVNRFNSQAEVKRLIQAVRQQGFRSISMDLIYGLPKQSCNSFARTLDCIIELSPDRVSLFNYAHMPHLFKTQKQIDARELPEPQEKLDILKLSIEKLLSAGYVYIGMDHFAKPDDELATAQAAGTLQRNFQGYATHADCDLHGFGLTSISAIGDVLIQNVKQLNEYAEKIDDGVIPHFQGVVLSKDDNIRKAIINNLMCHFQITFKEIETVFNIDFQHYFAKELMLLKEMQNDGLVQLDKHGLYVNTAGRLLIRRICMVFDSYLHSGAHTPTSHTAAKRYSRII